MRQRIEFCYCVVLTILYDNSKHISDTTCVQTKERDGSGRRRRRWRQWPAIAAQLHVQWLHGRGYIRANVQLHIPHGQRRTNSLHTIRVVHWRMCCAVHFEHCTFVYLYRCYIHVNHLVQGMTAPNRCTAVQYSSATSTCTLLQNSALQTAPITASNIQSVYSQFQSTGNPSDVYAEQVRWSCVSLCHSCVVGHRLFEHQRHVEPTGPTRLERSGGGRVFQCDRSKLLDGLCGRVPSGPAVPFGPVRSFGQHARIRWRASGRELHHVTIRSIHKRWYRLRCRDANKCHTGIILGQVQFTRVAVNASPSFMTSIFMPQLLSRSQSSL